MVLCTGQRFAGGGSVSEGGRSKSWAYLDKCDNVWSWGVSPRGRKGSQKGPDGEVGQGLGGGQGASELDREEFLKMTQSRG